MSNILRAHLKLTRLKSIFTIPSHSYQKRRSTKMAVSTATLSIGGNMLSGQLRRWEPHESKLFQKPRKNFRWFCLNELHLLSYRTKTLNFNPRGGLLPPFHAYGKEADDSFLSNANEDTDEILDDLLKKYGKVVLRKNDQKSPSAELDDDAESLSFAVAMAKVASDVKAADIRVLFVKPLVYWTRFFIIATAFSRPQIDAIGSKIRDLAEKKYGKIPSGDTKPNSWTLLDFGDVVIHIFLPQQRAFYNLEEFYEHHGWRCLSPPGSVSTTCSSPQSLQGGWIRNCRGRSFITGLVDVTAASSYAVRLDQF
ncbi:Lojap-related protein isoform 1 [Theobroma cacao]|uniref:Protein Iojap, chloroplastic n=1 Tax=Theobroma cacao TaxID=3641 RepID=A0A061F9S7_THECC|nr:Lojap-related protein isoform 1 [Theobroma cacao]